MPPVSAEPPAAESAPAPSLPTPSLPWSWPGIAVSALVLVHFLWLYAHFAPASMSPDANGYLVQARLMAEEGSTALEPKSPAQFVGTHWLETHDGVFHSRYPAGGAALFAVAWKIGGLDAALLVNLLLASATLLAVYGLARRFVDGWLSLLA